MFQFKPVQMDGVKNKWDREQEELVKQLKTCNMLDLEWQDNLTKLRYVAGVDLSFVKGNDTVTCACIVVLSYPNMQVVYEDCQMKELDAPYIPGYLAFREAHILVDLYQELERKCPDSIPQVILVDGNGILHPKGFGLACHLGILLDTPTIGVAKQLFHVDGLQNDDQHKNKIKELEHAGEFLPLVGDTQKVLGYALRSTEKATKPIYVSIGHKISLETAKQVVANCCKYRIPEPTRLADIKSREYLREHYKPEQPQTEPQTGPQTEPQTDTSAFSIER